MNKFKTWLEYKDFLKMNAKLDAIIDHLAKETKNGNIKWNDLGIEKYTTINGLQYTLWTVNYNLSWFKTKKYILKIDSTFLPLSWFQYRKLNNAINMQNAVNKQIKELEQKNRNQEKINNIFDELKLELPEESKDGEGKPTEDKSLELFAYKYATILGFGLLLVSWVPWYVALLAGVVYAFRKHIYQFFKYLEETSAD